MSKLIYAADDEKNIRELLELFLKDAGYIELEHKNVISQDSTVGNLYIPSYERKIYCKDNEQQLEFSMTEFSVLSYLTQYQKRRFLERNF